MDPNLFQEINNAVLDLQSSQLQTYDRPLRKLGQLLTHPDLEQINAELTSGLNLQSFLEGARGGSMVGSHRLIWPDDSHKVLGLSVLLIEHLAADPAKAATFGHTYFSSSRKIIDGIHALTSQFIIPFVRDYKSHVLARIPKLRRRVVSSASRRVFVVHGHDDGAREATARYLERLDFEVIILHEQANQGRTIIEKVEAYGDVGFAVVLLTPDDEGGVKGGTTRPRARQNVVLELGYFIGRLGRERVCALLRGDVEVPSDYAGVVWTPMDSAGAWRQALAKELAAADYSIDWNVVMS